MSEERLRGVLLYGLAAVVLLGGGFWFLRAAPDQGSRLGAWQATAEELLPDRPRALAETVRLEDDRGTQRTSPVDGGAYTLEMVCAGTGRVRVRVSTNRRDSGRAVPCSDKPDIARLEVALADEFYIELAGEDDQSGAVFRWRLERNVGY